MSNPSIYGGSSLAATPSNGGAVAVTIASKVGQGNDGTSIPCRRVMVQGAVSNASYTMLNINAAATSVLGLAVPNGGVVGTTITAVISTAPFPPALELKLDDVSKLYFWNATDGDIVNILYTK